MTDWRDDLDEEQRSLLKRKCMPHWSVPMLATLTNDRFSSPEWIYEHKLDGERCLAFRCRSRLHLLSRNKKDLNDTYPELVDALLNQTPQHFIADGEIVAFEGSTTSFSRLQNRIGIKDA